MTFFLYGEDSFRVLARRKELVGKFIKDHPRGFVAHYDAGEESARENAKTFLHTSSLFSPAKCLVLHDIDVIPPLALKEEFLAYGERPELLIVATMLKTPPKLYAFLLKSPIIFEEFKYLSGKEWQTFVAGEAKRLKVMLSKEALVFLSTHFVKNSWGLVRELEKLSGFASHEITLKDFESLALEASPEFWGIVQSFKSEAPSRRLEALEEILSRGEEPAKFFHILASFLPQKIAAFANYDLAIKSGKLDYDDALLDLALG